jgi:hypothetical protein
MIGRNFFERSMRRKQYAVTPTLPATFSIEVLGQSKRQVGTPVFLLEAARRGRCLPRNRRTTAPNDYIGNRGFDLVPGLRLKDWTD